MNRGLKLLISLSFGYIVYLILVLLYGSQGIGAYRELENYYKRLIDHTMQLEQMHTEIVAQRRALTQDDEALRLAVREIGYVRENEGFIFLKQSASSESRFTPGSIIDMPAATFSKDSYFRGVGAGACMLLFVLLKLGDLRKNGDGYR